MDTATDKKYMQLCLDLAQKALGKTYPNPMVGSVIVYKNEIIGSGFHKKAGGPHAEVHAIESVLDKSLLSKSTLYVNLEPCAHHGKTPPCSDLIIQHNISRVVIGCQDSYHEVSGKGIERMRNAGINVTVGVLEKESRELNKRFFTFHEKKRPYIILKWAQTQDGFIDQAEDLKQQKRGLWITDSICKKLVHKWRTEEPSILVGTNAAEIDNPQLTARLVEGKNPLRITIDIHNRLSENLHLKDGSEPTIIYTQLELDSKPNVEYKQIPNINIWQEIFDDLYTRNIHSILIEGGSLILNDVISKGLWDEMRVFTGPGKFIRGIAGPKLSLKPNSSELIGNSSLDWYYK